MESPYIAKLEKLYSEYFESVVKDRQLHLIESSFSSVGAYKNFGNDQLKFSLRINRGVTAVEISAIHGDELYLDLNKYVAWIYLASNPYIKPKTEQWRKIIGMRLSALDLSCFLNDNWDLLAGLLNRQNYIKTTTSILDSAM